MTAARISFLLLVVVSFGCTGAPRKAPSGKSDGGADAGVCEHVPLNHTPTAASCSHDRPPSMPGDGGTPGALLCMYDSDCIDGVNGRCITKGALTLCNYDLCFKNDDCADAGGVSAPGDAGDTDAGTDIYDCSCRDDAAYGANSCVPSNCREDSDCGPCGFCSPVPGGCGTLIGTVGYFCHTPQDECLNDSDCNRADPSLHCIFDPVTSTRWICGTLDCTG